MTSDSSPSTTTLVDSLCGLCQGIFTRKKPTETFPHHKNIHNLIKASNSSCRLCELLWSKFSPTEKLLVGVNVELPLLSESPCISYRLSSSLWRSAVQCIFDFPTPNTEHIQKEVAFLCLRDDLDAYRRSIRHQKQQGSILRSGTDITIASDSSAIQSIPWIRNTSTGSTTSLEQAKGWITKCVQGHSICSRKHNSTAMKLPTRLIRINPSEDGSLRLCDTQHLPQDTQYMTLSHCWGKKKFLTLTTKNMNKLRASIPIAKLTKSFQDAIVITRFMAIEFIWIDSLCIVQDSIEDWEKESLLMRDVYSNSYCNIAATHACDGEMGCFVDRSIEASPLTINIPPPYDWGDDLFMPGIYECRDPNLWEENVTKSFLLQRAWVFQERLLAPRVLHFASSQIFFECQEFRACELHSENMDSLRYSIEGWGLGDNFKAKIQSMLIQALDMQLDSTYSTAERRLVARISWMYVVNNFTACKLTRESDRLIAIAGLARFFQDLMGCRYLAGLWEDSLAGQLIWQSIGESIRTETYQAPSWSWASRPGQIMAYASHMRDVASMQQVGHDFSEEETELVKVCDVDIATTDGDPMSQVTYGRLRLKGILIPTMLDLQSGPEISVRKFKIRGVELKLLPDISGEILVGKFFCVMCVHRTVSFDGHYEMVEGLILRSTGKAKGQYERVGYIATSLGTASDNAIYPVYTPIKKSQEEKEMMTDDSYEIYDKETEQCIFTIV